MASGEMDAKALLLQHGAVLGDYGRQAAQARRFNEASMAIDPLNEAIDLSTHRFGVRLHGNLVYRRDNQGEGYLQYGTVNAGAGWRFIGDKLLPQSITPNLVLPASLQHLGEAAMTLAVVDSENGVGISVNASLEVLTVDEAFRYGWYHQSNMLVDEVRQMGRGDNIFFDNSPI